MHPRDLSLLHPSTRERGKGIFSSVLVTVCIIDSSFGIIFCQTNAIGLTISIIVRIGSGDEVGHLVNECALEEKWNKSVFKKLWGIHYGKRILSHHFRISSVHFSSPKNSAQVDLVWPTGINIRIILSVNVVWVNELCEPKKACMHMSVQLTSCIHNQM